MDADSLTSNLQHISSFGVGLNQSQRSALETSLIIAQVNHKFSDVRFWGKISGIKEDYFIVYGINKDEINGRQFLYRYVFPLRGARGHMVAVKRHRQRDSSQF